MFLNKKVYIGISILLLLSGCGGGSSKKFTSNTKIYTGYVIDAPIVNLTYKCGDKVSRTGEKGIFQCTVLPVSFFIGDLNIGSISKINADSKVFVQDIVQVKRDDFNNSKVLNIAILLQSLDKDNNISTEITIPSDANFSSVKSFSDLSLDEIKTLLTTAGITPVSSSNAQQHLREFSDIDTLIPTITLKGSPSIILSRNTKYTELGATVKDDRDKNITVSITGTVNTTVLGSYTMKYNASDKAGNKAKELLRKITIKEIAPIVGNLTDIKVNNGKDITPILFTSTGGEITSCQISPALPTGLSLSSDCQITGRATADKNSAQYTITASNSIGSVTATINIAVITIITPFTANDNLLEDQWYIKNKGIAPDSWGEYKNLTANADLNVTGAWNLGVSGEGIVVTVVDDGVDFQHVDLKNQEKKGYLYDYETGSKTALNLKEAGVNKDDHGTACAGIITAQANNGGIVGIAPNAKLTAHRILVLKKSPLAEMDSIDKIRRDNISQVSNHSYGPYDTGNLYPQTTEDFDFIEALVTKSNNGKGHVMIFASGNGRAYVPKDYLPSDLSSEYIEFDKLETIKATYGDYAGLDMSQQNPFVISVSGFDANDKEVSYAEAGPAVLVAGATGDRFSGPSGTNIKTKVLEDESYVVPDSTKLPAPAMATTGRANISYISQASHRDNGIDEPDGYNMGFNGTSASAPTVTGTVALMRSANPNLTWRDVRWILAKTARKIQLGGTIINQATGKPSVGSFAIPYWSTIGNSTFGLYSHYFGYGAVNAGKAVELAKSTDYKLLSAQKDCDFPLTNTNIASIPKGCPNTIEFVQVNYNVNANTNINDITLKMKFNNQIGKQILLLAPSTCKAGEGQCTVTEQTNVTGGTVGFLGDSVKVDDTFSFSISNSNGTSTEIKPIRVRILGYDQ